ncbi:SDR family NAD(P)-dependent oxidoreductase [Brunnivagina elsteri]|uniref:Oxidoreductase n=1 Tax=Brunnivagina elsteri CCALA 953 TaxID=987040 RepID=A0A2A2TFT3_9CYAN|nr:SDR family oxidoreductase [Calothrix elsteri]PAX52592.1 oxidoreductase [Calothrix elsteri CCALA 953]
MSTALITGASGGIGKAFAVYMAAHGINLVLVARSEVKLNQLASDLQAKHNIKVDVIIQDLTETGATKAIFDYTQERGITIDFLINNAGFGDYGDFAESDENRQTQIVQLNILALVDLTHKYLPLMRHQRSGNIINIASLTAFQPMPYISVYAATKAFVLSFSQALWAENRNYGVRILCSCPGPTNTNFFVEAKFPEAIAAKNTQVSTPEVVVRDTFRALEKGDSVVISGGFTNNAIAHLSRILPRKTLVSFLEKQFKV